MSPKRLSRVINPGGLAVALIGFGITRFVVAGTLQAEMTFSFAIGIIPLFVGLAFTLYGVVLAVGDLPEMYVRSVVRWTFLGVLVMIAVLGLTALAAPETQNRLGMLQESQLLVSNALLGGAVGGALTGDRAGVSRRHRDEIELQAELALIANGLLRHEVLNATAIINGYTSLFDDDPPRQSDVDAIQRATDRIEMTVSDVGDVGRARDEDPIRSVDLLPVLEEEIDSLRERYPEATFSVTEPEVDAQVLADHRLRLLVRKLLETVAERNEGTSVTIETTVEQYRISLSVSTTDGAVSFDAEKNGDPAVGFDRRIVELLSDYYGGSIEFDASSQGGDGAVSAVLSLPRATGEQNASGQLGVSTAGLGAAITAGLIAGVAMGVLSAWLSGLLPVIGALYGVSDPLVGWITHLFHSVVFGLLFAAGYTHFRGGRADGTIVTGSLLGASWGVLLWLVAAGFIMPIWLRLAGIPSALPNLGAIGLLTHVVWGLVLGSVYVALRRYFRESPRFDRVQSLIGPRIRGFLD